MHGSHGPKCSLKRCGFLEYVDINHVCRDSRVGEGDRWTEPSFSILLRNKYSKSLLYLMNLTKYAYSAFKTTTVARVLANAWWSAIPPYFGGVAKASSLTVDSWHERWPFCRLPVAGFQLHYDALERTVWLKTAISTLPVNMWLLHIFLRCSLVFSRWFTKKDTLS